MTSQAFQRGEETRKEAALVVRVIAGTSFAAAAGDADGVSWLAPPMVQLKLSLPQDDGNRGINAPTSRCLLRTDASDSLPEF